MNLVDRARLWLWRQRPRRRRRDTMLQESYQTLLHERPRSLDERVHHHFEHLDDYWGRCLGFLPLDTDPSPTFVAADWSVCIYVGSEAAAYDVRGYSIAHGRTALSTAWDDYERSLHDMKHAHPSVVGAVRRSAENYRRVRVAYGPAGSARSGLTYVAADKAVIDARCARDGCEPCS